MTHNQVANEIDKIIKMEKIPFNPIRIPNSTGKNLSPHIFTTDCLDVILKRYDLKNNKEYVVAINNGKQIVYKYSQNLVTFVISMITENKNIVLESKK